MPIVEEFLQERTNENQIHESLCINKIKLRGLKTPTNIALNICKDYIHTTLSQKKIGIKYAVSRSTIIRILNEYNIPFRERDKINPSKTRKLINCDENYFDNIDSADKAYWLGFILGDSYFVKDGSTFQLELHHEDVEILEKLKECLNSDHKITFRSRLIKETGNLRKSCSLSISRKKIYDDLIKNGIPIAKSKYCTIPTSIPKEFIRDFIRGIFCSDGCWYFSSDGGVTFEICSSVKSFLEEIQNVLIIECDLQKTKITSNKRGTCFELRYNGNKQCLRIFKYLYDNSNIKLMRKYNSIDNHFKTKC